MDKGITCEVPKWKEEANPPPAADYLAGNRPPMYRPSKTQKEKRIWGNQHKNDSIARDILENRSFTSFLSWPPRGLAGKTKRNERGRKRRGRRRRGCQNRPLPPLGPSSMAEHAAGNGEEKGERGRERGRSRIRRWGGTAVFDFWKGRVCLV